MRAADRAEIGDKQSEGVQGEGVRRRGQDHERAAGGEGPDVGHGWPGRRIDDHVLVVADVIGGLALVHDREGESGPAPGPIQYGPIGIPVDQYGIPVGVDESEARWTAAHDFP